ncbi:hypothetical protein D6D29_04282 [Aureobasidium pullulans]|nr:hypothetical protein D6D29_04282 [Aureobasidium pullulans]
MSDRHNNLPPTSKQPPSLARPENITAMSDRVSPTGQQAAVPTENPPSPQHANGHGHHHEHHHRTAQYGGNINPHETTEHDMAVFDRQMMALSEENTLASHIQACEIAEMFLERAELPLAFRVHAHIVLGCGKNDYLHHANEAVRFAEMGQRIYGPGKTPEAQAAVKDLMWQARETLRRAERDMEELEGIKESVKAGHLKLKSGQKLVYGNLNGEASDDGDNSQGASVRAVRRLFSEQRDELSNLVNADHAMNNIVLQERDEEGTVRLYYPSRTGRLMLSDAASQPGQNVMSRTIAVFSTDSPNLYDIRGPDNSIIASVKRADGKSPWTLANDTTDSDALEEEEEEQEEE